MKHYFLLSIFFLSPFFVSAQVLENNWVVTEKLIEPRCNVVDKIDNVYVGFHEPCSSDSAIVSKYNSSGTLLWDFKIMASPFNAIYELSNLFLDENEENLYLSLLILNDVILNNIDTIETSTVGADILLLKINTAGTLVWSKLFGEDFRSFTGGLKDKTDDGLLLNIYTDTNMLHLDSITIASPFSSYTDYFVKIDENGIANEGYCAYSPVVASTSGINDLIAYQNGYFISGKVYYAGYVFGVDTIFSLANTSSNHFIARLDSVFNIVWLHQQSNYCTFDNMSSPTVKIINEKVYSHLHFTDTLNLFGNQFVVPTDTIGSIIFSSDLNGANPNFIEFNPGLRIKDFFVTPGDSIYIAGSYTGEYQFGPLTFIDSVGSGDIVVAGVDDFGNFYSASQVYSYGGDHMFDMSSNDSSLVISGSLNANIISSEFYLDSVPFLPLNSSYHGVVAMYKFKNSVVNPNSL
ncbi:MAG: hypothetical protein H8E12_00020, partial [Rhodobacteraceae bacterium]|nr:hypothetical protein [Paracoccaceae bacterium]